MGLGTPGTPERCGTASRSELWTHAHHEFLFSLVAFSFWLNQMNAFTHKHIPFTGPAWGFPCCPMQPSSLVSPDRNRPKIQSVGERKYQSTRFGMSYPWWLWGPPGGYIRCWQKKAKAGKPCLFHYFCFCNIFCFFTLLRLSKRVHITPKWKHGYFKHLVGLTFFGPSKVELNDKMKLNI